MACLDSTMKVISPVVPTFGLDFIGLRFSVRLIIRATCSSFDYPNTPGASEGLYLTSFLRGSLSLAV